MFKSIKEYKFNVDPLYNGKKSATNLVVPNSYNSIQYFFN